MFCFISFHVLDLHFLCRSVWCVNLCKSLQPYHTVSRIWYSEPVTGDLRIWTSCMSILTAKIQKDNKGSDFLLDLDVINTVVLFFCLRCHHQNKAMRRRWRRLLLSFYTFLPLIDRYGDTRIYVHICVYTYLYDCIHTPKYVYQIFLCTNM